MLKPSISNNSKFSQFSNELFIDVIGAFSLDIKFMEVKDVTSLNIFVISKLEYI